MTDRPDAALPDEPAPDDATLAPLLGREVVWSDPDAGLGDDVVDAIGAETGPGRPGSRVVATVRRWTAPVAAGVAAALLVLGGASVLDGGPDRATTGVAVALAGTDLAPRSSAVATVADTPQGTRIDLDVSGLQPAGEDEYYEAWLWNSDGDAVSAGSFHLRAGDGSIELWAGVGLDDYPRMSVTREVEGEGVEPSGEVVLRSG